MDETGAKEDLLLALKQNERLENELNQLNNLNDSLNLTKHKLIKGLDKQEEKYEKEKGKMKKGFDEKIKNLKNEMENYSTENKLLKVEILELQNQHEILSQRNTKLENVFKICNSIGEMIL